MKPVERVLAALWHQGVDRVPWGEGIVQNRIATAVCGEPVHVLAMRDAIQSLSEQPAVGQSASEPAAGKATERKRIEGRSAAGGQRSPRPAQPRNARTAARAGYQDTRPCATT
ncbi:MAG: hypothetical protein AB1505_19215 [Candidatus Latescibacterota bacterium]